ncbi:hypothetical protein B0H10DRAFT_2228165 [Mycena sp. CBHHK59/15]|nr:hypothetical protein B0H10DRAFT_2228165 [Mycena sp. CBHHK59/15]
MDKIELLKARLLVAEAENEKKSARKAAKREKENLGMVGSGKKKRSAPTSENFHLTDELLTGQSEAVDTGGKTLQTLYMEVAERLFITDKTNTIYSAEDLPGLGGVIKNCVAALKKGFQEHHTTLGATGHGLVSAGQEGDIVAGSEIANA